MGAQVLTAALQYTGGRSCPQISWFCTKLSRTGALSFCHLVKSVIAERRIGRKPI